MAKLTKKEKEIVSEILNELLTNYEKTVHENRMAGGGHVQPSINWLKDEIKVITQKYNNN